MKIKTNKDPHAAFEWLAHKASKVKLSKSVLIFTQCSASSHNLLSRTLELAPAFNAARFKGYVATPSFKEIYAHFEDNPADKPTDLVVLVENVQPSQLLTLLELAHRGIKIHCTFTARL